MGKKFFRIAVIGSVVLLILPKLGAAQDKKSRPSKSRSANENTRQARAVTFPPALPQGQAQVSLVSENFLHAPVNLRDGVTVARTPPRVDFLFYPGQTYEGQPWSNWGDGIAVNGKYYSSIGDHLAIGGKGDGTNGTGTARVFEYDLDQKESFRRLVDVADFLSLPSGHYTPGKIHTRLDLGCDGWLYYATHRGSVRATKRVHHYTGDWILRTHPRTAETEVVVHAPVADHAIPNGMLDSERLIYYGGTAAGEDSSTPGIQFFAYDVKNRRLLYSGPDGPARAMILSRRTGRVYYVPGNEVGPLMRYDPVEGETPAPVDGTRLGIRCATNETEPGMIFTVSSGQQSEDASIWLFDTRTEQARQIGTAAVATQAYVASIDADRAGRFLYYVPGAHGGGDRDGSPIVQFDVATGRKKVIAFLEPFFTATYGLTLKGTYSTALSPAGDKLYVTWNVSRGSRAWDSCGLTVVHIPDAER